MKRTVLLFALASITAMIASGPFLACSEKGTSPVEDAGILLNGHRESVNSVDFSPDGSRLVSGGADSTIRIWNVDSLTLVRTIDCPSTVSFVRFDSTGSNILAIQSGEAAWWDAETGASVSDAPVATGLRPPYAFSASRNALASGGDTVAFVHDMVTGEQLGTYEALGEGPLHAVALSLDGGLLAGAYWRLLIPGQLEGVSSVVVWGTDSEKVLRTLLAGGGQIESLAWSPVGDRIVAAPSDLREQSVTLWNADTGDMVYALAEDLGRSSINVAYSDDGAFVAASVGARWARVWDARTGGMYSSFALPANTSELTFSPNERRLAAAGAHDAGWRLYDRSIHLWELGP